MLHKPVPDLASKLLRATGSRRISSFVPSLFFKTILADSYIFYDKTFGLLLRFFSLKISFLDDHFATHHKKGKQFEQFGLQNTKHIWRETVHAVAHFWPENTQIKDNTSTKYEGDWDFPNFVRSIFTKYENQVFLKRKIDKYHIYSSSKIYENAFVRSKNKHFVPALLSFNRLKRQWNELGDK